MVFYLIGLGLGDVDDISVKGLNIVRRCAKVYLESYTSILSHGFGVDRGKLEEYYGRELLEADREMVEMHIESMLDEARQSDIALLIVGDPFGATTHADLVLRAKQMDIQLQVVHNASILNAVGCCGLQLYNFGVTVSIPMWTDGWEPDSFLDKILQNRKNGSHTLCLLDIKTKEQSVENLVKGRKIYEPPRFMTCSMACKQILEGLKRRRMVGPEKQEELNIEMDEHSSVVGLARVGWNNQKILFCTLEQMTSDEGTVDIILGPPLHSLVVPAMQLHPMEHEMLKALTTTVNR